MLRAANISSIPKRSPFRYPGGKTWLVPQIRQWLRVHGGCDVELVEPFAGGGIVTLTSVMEELVGSATMIERDENVAAVWQAILGRSGRRLAEQIMSFEFTEVNVKDVLNKNPRNMRDRAFQTILKNRVNRNGILAPSAGMLKRGEMDYGLQSRWYPKTLAARILDIVQVKSKMVIEKKDGLRYLKKRADQDNLVYFIDPPYCHVGKRLYQYGEIKHERLFECAALLKGNFLMTYGNTEEISILADKYGFQTRVIWMYGGLNNAKMELLIGKNFDWMQSSTVEIDNKIDASTNGNGRRVAHRKQPESLSTDRD